MGKLFRQNFCFLTAVAFAALAVSPSNGLAYIDPGTGSVLVQALVAGAAGLGVALKLGWRKLFGPKADNSQAQNSSQQQTDEKRKASGS